MIILMLNDVSDNDRRDSARERDFSTQLPLLYQFHLIKTLEYLTNSICN